LLTGNNRPIDTGFIERAVCEVKMQPVDIEGVKSLLRCSNLFVGSLCH